MSSPIPKHYLRNPSQYRLPIKLLDVAVLLLSIHRGAQDDCVGFEDARMTLDELVAKLNKTIWIEQRLIESAMWSANLLDEAGKFWHPESISFEEFAKDVCGKHKFNRIYNLIERKR